MKFFSFASFSQSLSLLHPNWPENIFGKIYFTKPEFVLLPIIAFSSLFFLNFSAKDNAEKKNKKITILSFILMGLIGAFFSKGSNPPFGEIYYWMFNHIPGFIMFRDPTKWYLLIALSYSIIIPFTLSKFADKLSISKITMFKKLSYLILVIFLLIWSFCIKEAILGKLNGTFKPNQIPKEYFKFKEYIQSKPTYSATLWVPSIQRYGFNSKLYPAIDVSIFQNSGTKSLSEHLNDPKIKKMILGKGVRYVIIPYDSQKEIFIYDRKYSFQEYEKVINEIRKISWLKYDKHFGELFVFKVSIE
ncbi:MAG: hypothetical protein M1365_16145 [Actinobacteria bacterium]|nr:hypothetical protein [Actinomycetota bacterium]